jgi:hypothetical protein
MRWNVGRPRSLPNVGMEENILQVNERRPAIRVRRLVVCTGTSHTSAKDTLEE